jgi:hypothetical protein
MRDEVHALAVVWEANAIPASETELERRLKTDKAPTQLFCGNGVLRSVFSRCAAQGRRTEWETFARQAFGHLGFG